MAWFSVPAAGRYDKVRVCPDEAKPKRTVTLNSFQGLLLDCEIPDQVRNDNKDGVRNDNEEWVQSARVPAYGGRDRRRWAAGHRLGGTGRNDKGVFYLSIFLTSTSRKASRTSPSRISL